MNISGASLWDSLYRAKFESVGLSVPAANNASEVYVGRNASADIIPKRERREADSQQGW
jgi:hypothetical protein